MLAKAYVLGRTTPSLGVQTYFFVHIFFQKDPMKKTLRKIAAVVSTIALAFAAIVTLGASPASAAVRPVVAYDAVTKATINVPFDVDYSCAQDDPNGPATSTQGTWANEPDMEMPPGLSLDLADGHIKGTPTELGSYKLPSILCERVGFNEGFLVGSIVVGLPMTPNPDVSTTLINSADCRYDVNIMLPAVPDAGTVKLTIASANATVTATLIDLTPLTVYQLPVRGGNLAGLSSHWMVSSMSPAGPIDIDCGDPITVRVGYQSFGAQEGWAQLGEMTPKATNSTPSLQSESYNDAACTIRVTGVLPSLAFDTTPQLYIATDVFGYYIDLDELSSGQMFSYEFPLGSKEAIEALDGVKEVTQWGTTPDCSGPIWLVTLNAINEGYASVSADAPVRVNVPPVQCAPGTFSLTGAVPCTDAQPGFYVENAGERMQMPCPLGTFSADSRSTFCQPAPKGYYINTTGAASATKCAAGMTTELTGARSINECYKQKFQTAKAIKSPAKLKFGAKHETVGRADAGLALNAVAKGSCTVTKINKTVKINGKSVKQPRWVIKATSKAGNCKVTFSNDGDYTYKPFTVTKTIKVTKTGK
jgi:hypothetical protein